MTFLDRRRNNFQRRLITIAHRHKHHLVPYHAARFLCANSVPLEVALRVLTPEFTARP